MKVLNAIPLSGSPLVDYLHDDLTLRLIHASPQLEIFTVDPETLSLVNRLAVQTEPHEFYSACIDDNCIYVPTKMGQVLAIDKFSSEILATINLGIPIMSNLLQDDKHIYMICGVPLSRQWSLIVDNYCVCICDKETGKKKVQTCYFEGNLALISKDDHLWVIGGKSLLKFSLDGELLHKTALGSYLDYAPVTDDEFVICFSKNGMTRVLRKDDLSVYLIKQFPACLSSPQIVDKTAIWLTPTGICHLNYREQVFQEFTLNNKILSEVVMSSDKSTLFGCDQLGCIVAVDLNSHLAQTKKLTKNQLRKPVIVEDFLFTVSDNELHHLRVDQ